MPIYDFKLWFIYQINYNVRHLHVVDICLENRYSVPFYNIIGPTEYLQFLTKILFHLLIYLHWIIGLVEDIRNSAFFHLHCPIQPDATLIFSEITCIKSIGPNFPKTCKNILIVSDILAFYFCYQRGLYSELSMIGSS